MFHTDGKSLMRKKKAGAIHEELNASAELINESGKGGGKQQKTSVFAELKLSDALLQEIYQLRGDKDSLNMEKEEMQEEISKLSMQGRESKAAECNVS